MNCSGEEEEKPKSGTPKFSLNSHLVNQRGKLAVEALQLLTHQGLDFRVDFPVQGLQEDPVHLHKVSTSTFADQPTGAPAPLTSPEPGTNPFSSLCVLESMAMAPQPLPNNARRDKHCFSRVSTHWELRMVRRIFSHGKLTQLLAHAGRHRGGEDTTQKDPSTVTPLCSSFIHISAVGLG